MFNHRFTRFFLLFGLIFALVGVGLSAFAQDDEPENIILADEDGITLPEGLTAGFTTLVFQNDTESPFAPSLLRLIGDSTVEDLMGAMQQGPDAALEFVAVLGSPMVQSGESQQAGYVLQAGNHLLLSFSQAGPPSILPFTVSEAENGGAEAPEADVNVMLVDFAFAIPAEIEAGEQLWEITNMGQQVHHMLVFRVDDDAQLPALITEFTDLLHNAIPGQPPEFPYENVYTWEVISPGEAAYPTIDLPAGKYAVVCFIPDSTSEQMFRHLEHGMIRLVTVSE